MEHAISDFVVDRIDEYLGHPEVDPHGDPIPAADGQLRGSRRSAVPLNSCEAGQHVQVSRVMNQDPDFLRYLAEAGIEVGTVASVATNSPEAGIVELTVNRQPVSIGHQAAVDLLVVQPQSDELKSVGAGADS